MTRDTSLRLICSLAIVGGVPGVARAQSILDHVDPAKVEAALPSVPTPIATLPAASAPGHAASLPAAPVTVGAVALSGLTAMHPSDFADIFATYVGRTLSPMALAGLADAIADRARARGYLFVAVTIPPQQLEAGLLRLVVDEGRVDEVRVTGTDNPAAKAALAPLVGTGPVTADQVQRRLLLAGDVPGLSIRRTRLLREGDRDVLLVEMSERRVSGVVAADDFGSRTIGPVRLTAVATIAGLLAADDAVTFTVATAAPRPGELGYGAVRYVKRVSSDGTEVSAGFSYAAVAPGSYLADRDIVGRSWSAQAGASRPLLRRQRTSLWLQASFDVRSIDQDASGERVRRDRLSVARLRVYGYTTVFGGVLQGGATLNEGIPLFGATRAGDPSASRGDADGGFTSVAFAADWTGSLVGRLGARLSVAGQVASRPLLVAEELGLGGGQFLRPYDYSERSGDDGIAGAAELRYALARRAGPFRNPLLYGFVGGGSVSNLAGGGGGGAMLTAGGGLRSAIGTVAADAGIAFPLTGPRYDTGNRDPVLNVQVSRRF